MEPNEKPKFNWQRMLITSGFVLLAALVVGGTTWYVLDKSAKEIKTANDKSVSELQKQIDELKAVKATTKTTTNSTTNDPTAGWNTYTDSDFGFTLKYPQIVSVANDTNYKTTNTISIKTQKISDIPESMPLGLDRATAIQDKAAITSGDPKTDINAGSSSSFKLLTLNGGAIGKSVVTTSLIDVCNVTLTRTAYIYRNDYRITVTYNYNLADLQSGNSAYFKTDSGCAGKIWAITGGGNFTTDLLAGKTDQKTQDWYKAFDTTIKSLTFN